MAFIKSGDEMRVLAIRGGKPIERDHLVPKKELFIFAIQNDGLHDQIKRLSNQVTDFRAFCPSARWKPQPRSFVNRKTHLSVRQPFEQVLA